MSSNNNNNKFIIRYETNDMEYRENVLDFNLLCKQCALYIVSHFVAVNLNTVCTSPRFVCDLFIMMPYNQPYCVCVI